MELVDKIVAGGWPLWIIPVISAFVGWWTNGVAVRMMFHPTEFVGVKPYLGWQGIIPASALHLARKATDLILGRLISVKELFADFDASKLVKELGPALDDWTDQILQEAIAEHAPDTWAKMAEPARAAIRQMLRTEIEHTAVNILKDVHADVERVFDLRTVVIEQAKKDRKVIADIFESVGDKEFTFIRLSGLYFGLPFGIIQMTQWAAIPIWWTLPVAGFLVGYGTNWLAMKLIFYPRNPIKVGAVTLHGLFHKRQREVALEYSREISQKLMSPESIIQTITTGEPGQLLFGIVQRHVDALMDKYEKNPMAAMLLSPDKRGELRQAIYQRMRAELPKPGGFLQQFIERSVDIEGELFRRMEKLDADAFEGVLRPAFQQDEWKLIVVGGVLGFGAGFTQLVLFFSEVWRSVQF